MHQSKMNRQRMMRHAFDNMDGKGLVLGEGRDELLLAATVGDQPAATV